MPAARPAAVRRAAARHLGRHGVDRRGERQAAAARRVDGRLVVAARALRRRLARPPPRRGRSPRARALVAARAATGHERAVVAERLPRRLPLGPGPARGRRRRHRRPRARPRHVPADGVEARRARTCSPTCRARTSTSSTSTPRRRLARIRLPHVPHELAWSADGRRLYVNLHRSLAIYDASGRRTGRIWMPGRQTRHDVRARPQRLARGGGTAQRQRRARSR